MFSRIVITMLGFIILAIFSRCSNNKENEKNEIQKYFNEWIANEVTEGKYIANDSCNPSYFFTRFKNNKPTSDFGFPAADKFKYIFNKINDDQQIDALVTFYPLCCSCTDTGSISLPQRQILIMSNNRNYFVNDTFFHSLDKNDLQGNFTIDSISTNEFYGNYITIETVNDSAKRFQKRISINYNSKQFKIIR